MTRDELRQAINAWAWQASTMDDLLAVIDEYVETQLAERDAGQIAP